jgi:hypothetical protein
MAKGKELVGLDIAHELGLHHRFVDHFSVLMAAALSELQAT